jgi:class 3 adenylate cyclase
MKIQKLIKEFQRFTISHAFISIESIFPVFWELQIIKKQSGFVFLSKDCYNLLMNESASHIAQPNQNYSAPVRAESKPQEQRKVLAILFSDIKGYSAMMSQNETLALRLLDEHNNIALPLVHQNHGYVIKLIGDAILAAFESSITAVQCAVEIQNALAERNKQSSKEERILIRIGIHVGDVILKNNDAFGDGVNIAARLEPLATPGGILISRAVRDMILASGQFHLEFAGSRNLKNIPEPMEVYSVLTKPVSPGMIALQTFKNIIFSILKAVRGWLKRFFYLSLIIILLIIALVFTAIVSKSRIRTYKNPKETVQTHETDKENILEQGLQRLLSPVLIDAKHKDLSVNLEVKDIPLSELIAAIFNPYDIPFSVSESVNIDNISFKFDGTMEEALNLLHSRYQLQIQYVESRYRILSPRGSQ